jgi:hypothetical protein
VRLRWQALQCMCSTSIVASNIKKQSTWAGRAGVTLHIQPARQAIAMQYNMLLIYHYVECLYIKTNYSSNMCSILGVTKRK